MTEAMLLSIKDIDRALVTENKSDRINLTIVKARYLIAEDIKCARPLLEQALEWIESMAHPRYRKYWYNPHKARALFILAYCFEQSGSRDKGVQLRNEAFELLEEMPNKILAAETYLRFSLMYGLFEEAAPQLEYLSKALKILEDPNIYSFPFHYAEHVPKIFLPFPEGYPNLIKGRAYYSSAGVYELLGEYDLALQYNFNAYELFEKVDSRIYMGATLRSISHINMKLKRYDEALSAAHRGLRFAEEMKNTALQLMIQIQIAQVYGETQEYERAIEMLEELLDLCREREYHAGEATIYFRRGNIFLQMGEYTKAQRSFEKCSAIEVDGRGLSAVLEARMGIGQVYFIQKQYSRASETFTEVLQLTRKYRRKAIRAECHNWLSKTNKALGRLSEALEHLEECQSLQEQVYGKDKILRIGAMEVNRELQIMRIEAKRNLTIRETMERDLRVKERDITALTLKLEQQNQLIAKLKKQARQIARSTNDAANDTLKRLLGNLNHHQNAQHSWNDFDKLLLEQYPDFYDVLLRKSPDLTTTELRVCALIKSRYSVKEIAAALCVSDGAVFKSRWRIRKKLGLQRTEKLASHLALY